ncbi:chemotaxis protein CheB [Shewanella sp. D64]|uniref:chemotaxis protein CheB n=1 Tax=unclassified Shewanella TaxID=196818 RepID=UPI0022BA1E88|nr:MULTISPECIES: chemotaxis protein CheB [unclassified Shewanella]MEC4724820.1 chemotaxis protein CheB [Shewanella sp. D64]MEC4736386.1 chemotaxis protein CheB [Shewanella sp. E94]WBJ97555.1 chemotaxis protein CheB [Shewanella sp. MTB7]
MYEAIVVGVSAGGLHALSQFLPCLPPHYPLAVIVVQHRHRDSDDFLVNHLNNLSAVEVKEAEPGELIQPGYAYIAPAGYHLLVERDKTLSLSIDLPVNYSIPSIDVLFQSAATCYKNHLIGLILTGANSDGSLGLQTIKQFGGYAIVQDPQTAEVDVMLKAAIDLVEVDNILSIVDLGNFFAQCQFESQSVGDKEGEA